MIENAFLSEKQSNVNFEQNKYMTSVSKIVSVEEFQSRILQGIPEELPVAKEIDTTINHAPKRKDILNAEEKKLAVRNALRYFPKKHHKFLATEFAAELKHTVEFICLGFDLIMK